MPRAREPTITQHFWPPSTQNGNVVMIIFKRACVNTYSSYSYKVPNACAHTYAHTRAWTVILRSSAPLRHHRCGTVLTQGELHFIIPSPVVRPGKSPISYFFFVMFVETAFVGLERRSKYTSSSFSDNSSTVLLSYATRYRSRSLSCVGNIFSGAGMHFQPGGGMHLQ